MSVQPHPRVTGAPAEPTPSRLAAEAVTVGYGGLPVLRELSLSIAPGSGVALVGPNGSGKSTVLRALGRLLPVEAGAVLLDGDDLRRARPRQVARSLAVLAQDPSAPDGLTVAELVRQGRYPHLGPLRPPTETDRAAVAEALALTATERFADRPVRTLSGGERQRVWLALTLAQDARTLLLDEPTTYLDVGHQLEVLDLVARLRAERGLTVVTVLHDLDHAARYADRIVALRGGRIVADGPPDEVVTPRLLAEVFRVRATVLPDPETGRPVTLVHAPLEEG